MDRQELRSAAQKLKQLAEIATQQIDAGFRDGDDVQPGDPRLQVLHNMFSNPQGALNTLLGLLGGPTLAPRGGVAPAVLPSGTVTTGGVQTAGLISLDIDKRKPATVEDKAVELPFDEFLTSVGDAMLSAQKQLDQKSAEYLSSIENQPHILPSIFRLPKLSASMKFALEQTATDRLNLVFFSSGSQQSSQHQQEIDFEIVSVPAPMEALSKLRQSAPQLNLLLNPGERKLVLDAARNAKAKKAASKLPDGFAPERALLLTVEPGDTYLLLYADSEQDGNVGLWRVKTSDPTSLEVIYRFDKQFADAEVSLRDLVLTLATKQQQFLKTIGA